MKRICLGKIASVHGVKGLLKITPYGEDPTLIETITPIFTSQDQNDTLPALKIKSVTGKYLLVEAKGCTTREQADSLRGTELWVSRESLPEIEEDDEYYIDDLIGITALENNEPIGTVIAIPDFGSGPLLEIKQKSGQSILLPFTNDFVGDVNLTEKTVNVMNTNAFKVE